MKLIYDKLFKLRCCNSVSQIRHQKTDIKRYSKSKMAENPDPKSATSIFEFKAQDIDGNEVSLSKYEGYVTFIVNLASK